VFPTEREIYHRLRWDPRFDLRRCHVVFTLRPTGTKRVPFLDHDIEAIPWHRIIEFWIDDELAWSRPERIDRLDELAAARDEPAAAPDSVVVPAYAFASGTWSPVALLAPATPASLRVLTWNLLFDRYDAEILRSDERWQDALDRIGALELDLIALVEVTPAMWQRVLAQSWVRRYAVSHAPETSLLEPFGQVVLSRFPIREVRVLELARRRQAVVTTVAVGDRSVGVAAIHLTSDRADDAPALREAQLGSVLAHVRQTPRDAWIVMGDFNSSPETFAPAIAAVHAVDAWEVVHPADPGHTFDPRTNSLAAAMTSTGRTTRLDRVVALGLQPTAARLIGIEPGPAGIPPSDHYGVYAELAIGDRAAPDLRTAPMTRRVSLAIVPPLEAWPAIQRVRCAMERGFGRWPPHITLAHPFVDDAWLDRALGVLRDIAANAQPFSLELDRITPIEPTSRTIVMFPDRQAARAIERIHAAVREAIPDPEGDGRYLPHLTIARDVDARTIEPFTVAWRVDRLTILREHHDRFEVAHEIMLGGGSAPARPEPERRHEPIVAQVVEAAQLVDATAIVQPYGSIVYAPAHASDIDVVVEIDQPVDVFAGELATLLELAQVGAPGHLRGTVGGRAVELSISSRAEPDERMLAGPRDGHALLQHLRDHGRHDAFLAMWPDVRRFVHARALSGNGLGYFGSFGWAMLLAIPLCHDRVETLAAWFAWLARIEPGSRLGFDAVRPGDPAPLWIAAPTPPARNAARAVTPGTFAVLHDEFRRATRADPFANIDDGPPPGTRLTCDGPLASRGAYEGRFRALLGALESSIGPVVRPWGRFAIDGSMWRHSLVVPAARADEARAVIARFDR